MKQLLLILLLTFVLAEVISPAIVHYKKPMIIEIIKPKAIIKMPLGIIDDSIFIKQINIESRGKQFVINTNGEKVLLTNQRSGALGIAQFLPSTWKGLKRNKVLPDYFNIEDENHQRIAQQLFMNHLACLDYGIDYNKTRLAIASYNAGYGKILKLISKYGYDWENYLPNETKKYLKLLIG